MTKNTFIYTIREDEKIERKKKCKGYFFFFEPVLYLSLLEHSRYQKEEKKSFISMTHLFYAFERSIE